jgi:hypothetical protein
MHPGHIHANTAAQGAESYLINAVNGDRISTTNISKWIMELLLI